jgi:hypothetical protein
MGASVSDAVSWRRGVDVAGVVLNGECSSKRGSRVVVRCVGEGERDVREECDVSGEDEDEVDGPARAVSPPGGMAT